MIRKFSCLVRNAESLQLKSVLNTLAESSYLLCPKFKCKTIKNEELIFLVSGHDEFPTVGESIFNTKTETEALENHVHLFDHVPKNYEFQIKEISMEIAENLYRTLKYEFPECNFAVYLELSYENGAVIRFHQIWDGEDLYFDPSMCKCEYMDGKIQLIRD